MKKLIETVRRLRRSRVKKLVDARMREFAKLGKKPSSKLFKELCFCLLTANFNAEKSMRMQGEIGKGFCTLPEKALGAKLKELGHRHPNTRAGYIAGARRYSGLLKKSLKACGSEEKAREWLVKSIKGIGMKEASHFLRNIGFKNVAIIDFHIIELLVRTGLIKKPKTLTKHSYLEIEKLLKKLAEKLRISLAELDLYLWYAETGKVLK